MTKTRIALALAVLFAFSLQTLAAQTPPAFEVAAIHQNPGGQPNTRIDFQPGGRLVIVNASLQTLIRNAYGLLPFQLTNLKGWSDDLRFDINAKTVNGADLTQESYQPLMQNLLAERFHLKSHWETREMPIYTLVTEKDGPRFQPHAGASGAPDSGMNTRKRRSLITMTATDVPMADFVSNLAFQLGRFVVDDTHLAARYDFVLHFDPDPTGDSTEPSLFTALHEQLGLKLESGKGPVKVLVIDSAEKPTEN
jgi:uncharacterized protein (TIGR03435 family)